MEDHRLRAFENRILRRISGPKRCGIAGDCRKRHNEEPNNFHPSPNITRIIKSRRTRWAGIIAQMGGKRHVYRFSMGKAGGKRPLGRPKYRSKNNIKTDVREI
jgi:hypothetical protein